MQPQSGNSVIQRAITWLRGLWESSGERRRASTSGTSGPADSGQDQSPPVPAKQNDDIAATGAAERDTTGASGASKDEFSTGGYTPDNPDLQTVEDAAEPVTESDQARSGGAATLVDQEMSQPPPPSGNYGVGNLGLGSRGSLGNANRAESQGMDDATSSPETPNVAPAIPDETEARQGNVVASGDDPTSLPDDLANVSDPDLPASAEENVRGISDAGEDELGRLDALDQEAIAFEDDATERFDANSEPGFASDVPDTLADIDYETEDYSSSTLQDAGLRIVEEDEAGLTMREPGADEFVDPGSVVDEAPHDTGDARPLGDYSQQQSGIANEADEPTSTAGDRSDAPFSSETGLDTADTWTEGSVTGNLGASGELAAMDFGSTVGDEDTGLEATGLFGVSDIDVTDLSYLDESENSRFDFTNEPGDTGVGADDVPESAGPVDDIGASATGVSDVEGVVDSELPVPPEPVATDAGMTDAMGSGSDMVDAIADSPTGVVDANATAQVLADDSGDVREHVPLAATDVAQPTRSGPGGSVRGEESGSCPADFPIKGNSSSKIYHLPEAPSYAGTKAEWCFASEEQAQAAGYRPPGQRNRGGGGRSSSGPKGSRSGRGRGASR